MHAVVTVLTLLIFLPLLIFRKTRAAACGLLIVSGSYWAALLWFESFLFLVSQSAWAWLIWGLLLALGGVIPSALLYSAVHLDWETCDLIASNLLWIAGTGFVARYFITRIPAPAKP
jgi:hypothetical protein